MDAGWRPGLQFRAFGDVRHERALLASGDLSRQSRSSMNTLQRVEEEGTSYKSQSSRLDREEHCTQSRVRGQWCESC